MIDVDEGTMTIRCKNEKVNFDLFQAKHHKEEDYSKVKAHEEIGLELKRKDDNQRPKHDGNDTLKNSYKPP